MSTANQQTQDYSARAYEKLQEASCRIRTPNTAYDLWEKVFTPLERERLGGDFDAAYNRGGAVRMWATIHGCTDLRAVIDVAHKLNHLSSSDREWLLKESGEKLNAEDAYEDAILREGLVLNSATREIHWNGEPIAIDWSHEAKWSFMWELAKQGKAGLPIDSMTFGGRKKPNYVSKMKSELANHEAFPLKLADRIEVVAKGTQRLSMSAEAIRLFENHIGGEIREWTP